MTTRLSDILDRLRPTGTPGAPSEGSGQREEDNRQHETSAVVACLLGFENEANTIVEEAHQRADQIRAQAQTRVRQIDDELPDRIATAGTSATRTSAAQTSAEQERILASATTDVERIQHDVDAKIADVTLAATALVWASISATSTPRETS